MTGNAVRYAEVQETKRKNRAQERSDIASKYGTFLRGAGSAATALKNILQDPEFYIGDAADLDAFKVASMQQKGTLKTGATTPFLPLVLNLEYFPTIMETPINGGQSTVAMKAAFNLYKLIRKGNYNSDYEPQDLFELCYNFTEIATFYYECMRTLFAYHYVDAEVHLTGSALVTALGIDVDDLGANYYDYILTLHQIAKDASILYVPAIFPLLNLRKSQALNLYVDENDGQLEYYAYHCGMYHLWDEANGALKAKVARFSYGHTLSSRIRIIREMLDALLSSEAVKLMMRDIATAFDFTPGQDIRDRVDLFSIPDVNTETFECSGWHPFWDDLVLDKIHNATYVALSDTADGYLANHTTGGTFEKLLEGSFDIWQTAALDESGVTTPNLHQGLCLVEAGRKTVQGIFFPIARRQSEGETVVQYNRFFNNDGSVHDSIANYAKAYIPLDFMEFKVSEEEVVESTRHIFIPSAVRKFQHLNSGVDGTQIIPDQPATGGWSFIHAEYPGDSIIVGISAMYICSPSFATALASQTFDDFAIAASYSSIESFSGRNLLTRTKVKMLPIFTVATDDASGYGPLPLWRYGNEYSLGVSQFNNMQLVASRVLLGQTFTLDQARTNSDSRSNSDHHRERSSDSSSNRRNGGKKWRRNHKTPSSKDGMPDKSSKEDKVK